MKICCAGLAAALLISTSTGSIAQEPGAGTVNGGDPLEPLEQGEMFEALDDNKDGRLDPEEAGATGENDAAFTVIDADGDGYISREEYGTNLPNQ